MKKIALLDIREQELLIFVLNKKDYSILSGHSIPFTGGKKYSFTLPEELRAIDETYLSLPLNLLNFRIIELPFSEKKKVLELVPYELDGIILGGSGSIVFDVCIIEENGRSKVLVVYIRKDVVSDLLSACRSHGFDPRTLLSVELGYLLANTPTESLAGQILAPVNFSDEDRIGMAVKELQNPTVDFRKAEFTYTADTDKLRKSLRLTAVFVFLLINLFLIHSALSITSSAKENQAIKDEIRKVYQATFPDEKRITSERYQLSAHLKELREKESSFLGTSPLQVLLALTEITGPGVSLNEITVDKDIIILKGECPSLSDVQKIKSRLDELLTGAGITDTKPSAGNKMLFTITAKGLKI